MFINVALKLIIGLAGLVLVVRLVGKKALSDLTPFDIIYALVLGGILEEAIYEDKVTVSHMLFGLFLWGALIYMIEVLLQKKDTATRRVKGKPSVLIYKGKMNLTEITANHFEMEQLRDMVRQQGCFSLREVSHLILEANGQSSLMRNEAEGAAFSFLLIDEGEVEKDTLHSLDKDEAWLKEELQKNGFSDSKSIVYAEWSEEAGLYCLSYDDCWDKEITIDG